jgi:hypothetical protein
MQVICSSFLFLQTNISRLTMTGDTAVILGYQYDNLSPEFQALRS